MISQRNNIADPVSALIMVPLIAKEGVEAMNGEKCCD